MGFQLTSENVNTSCTIYVPFWQGALVRNIWLVSSAENGELLNLIGCMFSDTL